MKSKVKIGVFDSGVGGITVLTELRRKLVGADFVYLGDTAHVPYGTRSPAQIEKLSRDCARRLRGEGVQALVVACNTAASWAMQAIQEEMGQTPVFGVVEPGVEAALGALDGLFRLQGNPPEAPREKRALPPVLVLATKATVRSGTYGKILRTILEGAAGSSSDPVYPVIEQACPLLVPMIEEGWVDHPILHDTVREYVAGHVRARQAGVALLACTHYPWIHAAFERALPGWRVVNSAQAVSQAVARSEFWMQSASQLSGAVEGRAQVDWIFTDPDAVPGFAQRLVQQISAGATP